MSMMKLNFKEWFTTKKSYKKDKSSQRSSSPAGCHAIVKVPDSALIAADPKENAEFFACTNIQSTHCKNGQSKDPNPMDDTVGIGNFLPKQNTETSLVSATNASQNSNTSAVPAPTISLPEVPASFIASTPVANNTDSVIKPGSHGAKTSTIDPIYPGVRHGTRSNKFSRTIRKFFKRSWWAKGKKGPNDGYGVSDSDNSSFSSASDWGDPYDNPILRKRDYVLLVLRETAGKKDFVSFIDVDKQIKFNNRYHRIRRWKNINAKSSASHANQSNLQPGELIPEFLGESNHEIFGKEELSHDLTMDVPFQQKNKTKRLPKSSSSAFGIDTELNNKNPFTRLKCVRPICSAPVFSSTDIEPIESIIHFDRSTSSPLGLAILPVAGTVVVGAASATLESGSTNVSHTRVTRDFHTRFAPIQPAAQEGLQEIKMVTMIEDPKFMSKNWTPRFVPRDRTPQRNLADTSKKFVSSTSDETKVDFPFSQELITTTFRENETQSYGFEAVRDDATVVSPYPVEDHSDTPRFFSGDPIPDRISTSRQNDDNDVSIISMMNHFTGLPDKHKTLPSYINGIVADYGAAVNISVPPVPHIKNVVDIPQVEPSSFIFDVDIQQNIEAIVSSKNNSECLPHIEERRRSSVVSSSGFVYDINLQKNIEAIIESDYFVESQPTKADWCNYEFVLPKRGSSEPINVPDVTPSHYPSIQSSLSDKELCDEGTPGYIDAEDDLVPLCETHKESCLSFDTVIHYDLGNIDGESTSAHYSEEFDVSDLKLDGEEQDSPFSNTGTETPWQKKNLGSLFTAAAEVQWCVENDTSTNSLEHPGSREVIISTLLAENLHCQIGLNDGEPVITVHNEAFECCVPQSEDDHDNDKDDDSDIANHDGRVREIVTESKGIESIPAGKLIEKRQIQTNSDGLGLMKTPNVSPSFNVGSNGISYDSIAVPIDQKVPQLGAYRHSQRFEEKVNYDEIVHFILGIDSDLTFRNPAQENIFYHETSKEINSDSDGPMSSLKQSNGDKDDVHKKEESWAMSNLSSSLNPARAPAFVEELFENQDYESERRNNHVTNGVIKVQPQYEKRDTAEPGGNDSIEASSLKAQRTSPSSSSSSSSWPPSPIGLDEQQLAPRVRTRKTSVAKHSPLERICFVHWPIVKENLVATILGDYCPLKLRNNIRFNYDSHEFKIHQYYMTTRAVLQEQYKTHRKVVFTPKPGKWLNFEWETDILDAVDDFIRINKNLYPMYKGPRIIERKHLIRRWRNRDRDRLIILEQLLDYWRDDPFIIDQLKWEKQLMQPSPLNPSLSAGNEPPKRPSLTLVLSKIFEKMTMDLAHKKLGRPPRKGSSVVLLKEGPPLGIDYFGYKREKLRDWFNHLLLQL